MSLEVFPLWALRLADGVASSDRISLPRAALTAAALLAVALAVLARNHSGLAAAVRPGILSSPRRTTRSNRPSALQQALNPFSMTTLLFAIALLGSAAVLPPYVSVQILTLQS